jgi:hypothetical protein
MKNLFALLALCFLLVQGFQVSTAPAAKVNKVMFALSYMDGRFTDFKADIRDDNTPKKDKGINELWYTDGK